MAILSECRDDTDDMLWDICKENNGDNVSCSLQGHWRWQRRQRRLTQPSLVQFSFFRGISFDEHQCSTLASEHYFCASSYISWKYSHLFKVLEAEIFFFNLIEVKVYLLNILGTTFYVFPHFWALFWGLLGQDFTVWCYCHLLEQVQYSSQERWLTSLWLSRLFSSSFMCKV